MKKKKKEGKKMNTSKRPQRLRRVRGIEIELEYPFAEDWDYGTITFRESRPVVRLLRWEPEQPASDRLAEKKTMNYERYLVSVREGRVITASESVVFANEDEWDFSMENLILQQRRHREAVGWKHMGDIYEQYRKGFYTRNGRNPERLIYRGQFSVKAVGGIIEPEFPYVEDWDFGLITISSGEPVVILKREGDLLGDDSDEERCVRRLDRYLAGVKRGRDLTLKDQVLFLDGDNRNYSLDNLLVTSRARLLSRELEALRERLLREHQRRVDEVWEREHRGPHAV